MLKKIIDVSHYDPASIDWAKAKADGVDGVIIKCTQGTGFADPLCVVHAKNAKAEGLLVGYYHFAASEADPAQEAKFFASKLLSLPNQDILPVLDIETNKSNLTPAQIETWIQKFKEAFAGDLMLYSYQPFLDQFLPENHQFGSWPLWLACYRGVAAPPIPKGWAKVDLWQFTNEGQVDGIPIKVDVSKAFTDSFLINPLV